jgi:nucleoside-diphosphate-sugar epimerase
VEPGQQICGALEELDLPGILEALSPDVIVHCLGVSPQSDKAIQEVCYLDSTRYLLDSIAHNNATKVPVVVLVGSAAEYGLKQAAAVETDACFPSHVYGEVKLAQSLLAQQLSRQFKIPLVVARIFNIYGATPSSLAISSMTQQLLALQAAYGNTSQPATCLKVQNLESCRDFVFVEDTMHALYCLSQHVSQVPQYGEFYNIGTGQTTSLREVIQQLCHKLSLPDGVIPLSGFDERSSPQKTAVLGREVQHGNVSLASIHKICTQTGWKPVTCLSDGLDWEIAYWREILCVTPSVKVSTQS